MVSAFYNEFDKSPAAWLRQLIKNELITNGEVDERSITEVQADDIRGFDRVHWFAGIGGWDYALQLAGWGNEPVWTASLPCQPFSNAGKGLGKKDERHLLPHFLELVKECRPRIIFGEQVESAIRHGWLDDLCDHMEGEGYTVRAAVLTAAGVGAPHIRKRLYWVAYSESERGCGRRSMEKWENKEFGRSGSIGRMGNAIDKGLQGRTRAECSDQRIVGEAGLVGGMENALGIGRGRRDVQISGRSECESKAEGYGRMGESDSARFEQGNQAAKTARYRNTLDSTGWSDIEWLECRDGKQRPIKSGLKPLVDGISRGMVHSGDSGMVKAGTKEIDPNHSAEARQMRLKGYGNAIVPPLAAEFIKAFINT